MSAVMGPAARRWWLIVVAAIPLTFGLVSCRLSNALPGVPCSDYSGKRADTLISAHDLRPGRTIDLDGRVLQVLSADNFQPVGRGGGLVRTKLKDVEGGGVFDKTFRSDQKIETAHVARRQHQYLYSDGQYYHFMDDESYEQVQLSEDDLGEQRLWLKEGENVILVSYESKLIGVEVPNTVDRRIVKTDPGLKGDTATGGEKPAVIEGGATVTVPLFISVDDVVRVDTRSGEYVERVSS